MNRLIKRDSGSNTSESQDNAMATLQADNFWEMDLEKVESVFLGQDGKVTDLPTTVDAKRVPAQGSVLLRSVVNIDEEVPEPTLLQRVLFKLR